MRKAANGDGSIRPPRLREWLVQLGPAVGLHRRNAGKPEGSPLASPKGRAPVPHLSHRDQQHLESPGRAGAGRPQESFQERWSMGGRAVGAMRGRAEKKDRNSLRLLERYAAWWRHRLQSLPLRLDATSPPKPCRCKGSQPLSAENRLYPTISAQASDHRNPNRCTAPTGTARNHGAFIRLIPSHHRTLRSAGAPCLRCSIAR